MPGGVRTYLQEVLRKLQEVEVDENVKQDVRQLAGSIRKLVADYRDRLQQVQSPLPVAAGVRADVVTRVRDQLQELANRLLTVGSDSIGLWDGVHYVIITTAGKGEGAVPILPRKHRIPDDVVLDLLHHKIDSYPCPICGAPSKLVMRPGDPVARGLYDVVQAAIDYIDKVELAETASRAPFYHWARHVKYLGPASIVKMFAIYQTAQRRHIVPTAPQLWRLSGLPPVSYCPVCKLIDETPAAHNYRCPICGRVLEDKAPSKIGIRVLQAKLGDTVKVARFNDIRTVKFSEYIPHITGNPRFNSYMMIIAEQYRPMPNKAAGVYTVVALEEMLKALGKRMSEDSQLTRELATSIASENEVAKAAIEELQRRREERMATALSKALSMGGIGVATVYSGFGIKRKIAKMLLDHAAAAAAIRLGNYQGPPPIFQGRVLGNPHRYIPPLVDDPPDQVIEDEYMRAMVEWFEDHGIDLVKVWEHYQAVRDRQYKAMYSELLNMIDEFVKKHATAKEETKQ